MMGEQTAGKQLQSRNGDDGVTPRHVVVFGKGEVLIYPSYSAQRNRVAIHLMPGKHGIQVGGWGTPPPGGIVPDDVLNQGYTLEFATEKGLQVFEEMLGVVRAGLMAREENPGEKDAVLKAMEEEMILLGDPNLSNDTPLSTREGGE